MECSSLTGIDLSNTQITEIQDQGFRDCTSLTDINLPDTLTSIGNGIFRDCTSLTGIDLPDALTNIGESAFNGCLSLTGIDLPRSIMSIKRDAFDDCSFSNINYAGTIEEWNAIDKTNMINKGSGASYTWYGKSAIQTITCTDGVTNP